MWADSFHIQHMLFVSDYSFCPITDAVFCIYMPCQLHSLIRPCKRLSIISTPVAHPFCKYSTSCIRWWYSTHTLPDVLHIATSLVVGSAPRLDLETANIVPPALAPVDVCKPKFPILIYHHPQYTASRWGEQTLALYWGLTVFSFDKCPKVCGGWDGLVTCSMLDGPGIESSWRCDFPCCPDSPTQPPVQWALRLSWAVKQL